MTTTDRVGEAIRAAGRSIANNVDQLRQRAEAAEQERDDARAEAAGARSDYEELQGVNTDLARQRDDLHRELTQARAALLAQAGIHSATDSTPELVGRLAAQLRNAQAHHADLHRRLNTAENDVRSQTRALNTAVAETDHIATELAEERTLHDRTRTELEQLRAAVEQCAAGYEQIDGGTEKVKVYAADVAAKIRAAAADLGSPSPRAQEDDGAPDVVDQAVIEGLLANVARSLASADSDDERAEAIEMLLSGWYAAWPASAVTDPDAPLAAELVRLLRATRGAQDDDLADRLAAALADVVRRLDIGRHPGQTSRHTGWVDVATIDGWRALLAEHADRSTAAGWEREADRLDGEATQKSDPPFCRRCGHACNHNPPHPLEDTPDGPVCEDVAWCQQLQRADERTRAELRDAGWNVPEPAAKGLVSSVIAASSKFAHAAGHPAGGDWVRLRTGSGRQYEGHRAAACPGDGVAGHRHDVRCVERAG